MNTAKQGFAEHLLENATWPERILWSRLRHKQIGYSFQRQALVCGFIADFWCHQARVVVELDGEVHSFEKRIEADSVRDEVMAKARIAVLRFANGDVRIGMSAVLIRVWDVCFSRAPYPLKPFFRANPTHRYEDSVEFEALHAFQQQKREAIHASDFAQLYRAKRAQKNQGRWI